MMSQKLHQKMSQSLKGGTNRHLQNRSNFVLSFKCIFKHLYVLHQLFKFKKNFQLLGELRRNLNN